jgi:putative hydrolase of the HAD superfamily
MEKELWADIMPNEMKTFVFDADGVVCIGQNFSMALEDQHHIPHEQLASFFAGPFADCILGRRDLREVIAAYAADWGWSKSVDDLLAFWFQQEHVMCSQVLECVRMLRKKGHLCVLGTNQEAHRAAYLRREMRLAEEFDQIFPSCELGAVKPSIEFFRGIQGHLKLQPTDLCLIDDSDGNIAGARAAGWNAIGYRSTADIPAIEKEANQRE